MEEFKKYPEYKNALLKLGARAGFKLNLDNPQTIQDKINWMKLYDSTPLKTRCADKIAVHDYCKEKIGEDLCIPIIKTYDAVSEIEWDKLPKQFVIKCNHGSGMNIIVKDKAKMNKADVINKLNRFMKDDFAFHVGYEMHYHDIPHRILVEKYMEDSSRNGSLYDYKFWCFNGEPKFMTVNDGFGHGTMDFYDMSYKPISLARADFKPMKEKVQKPKTFDLMVQYAKKLSEDFSLVRVDFYEINGKLYLGELTFTPGAGFFKFKTKEDDLKYGKMIKLD